MGIRVNDGALSFVVGLDDSELNKATQRLEARFGNLSRNINRNGSDIESILGKMTVAVGGFFSVQAASGFVNSLIKVRSEFQQLDIAFTTMLKSKAASDKLMSELITFSAATPFGLKEAAGAAKQLLAYGSTANTVVGELRMLGDVASGVSVPISDLVYLYGTLKTQGRAYAMDIRQFAGRGIPIYAELAKILRVGKDEVAGLVEAGKVGFPQVEQAFKNMTSAAGMFGGLMEAQSKTLTGQIERFKDAWDIMLNDIAKGQDGIFTLGIESATSFVENYNEVLDILGLLLYSYGAYRTAIIATSVAQSAYVASLGVYSVATKGLLVQETLLAGSKRLLISLQATYNAVLAASPIGATVALLASLGAVIYSLTQYVSAAEATQDRFNNIQEESGLSANKEARNIKSLVDVIKSQVATNEQREAAYKKLQESTKGVLIGYSQEEIAAGKAKNAIESYVKSIREATVARTAFSEFQKLNDQLAELESKGVSAISIMDRAALRLKGLGNYLNYKVGGVPEEYKDDFNNSKAIAGFGGDANAAIVANQKKNLQAQLDALSKKFNKQITSELTKSAPGEDIITRSKKRSVDAIDKDITKLKEEQKALSETSKQYAAYQVQITKLEAEKTAITGRQSASQKKEISERQKFLNDLLSVEEEAFRKGLTKDQQEIKAAQDKAEALRVNARKNGLGAGVITRIDNIEKAETGVIKYRNETDLLKTELDKQREIYQAFETDRNQIGESAAKLRYGNAVKYSTLLEDLEAQLGDLLTKDPIDMSGPERERLQEFQGRINEQVKIQRQANNTVLDENRAYEQLHLVATERYNNDMVVLQGEANKGARAVRTQSFKEELDQISNAQLQKSEIYKRSAAEALILTKQETIKQISALNKLIESGTIPSELVAKIQSNIDLLKFNLKIGIEEGNLNALKDEFQRVSDQLHVKDSNGADIILSDEDYKSVIKRLAEIQLKIDGIMNPSTGKAKSSFAKGLEDNFSYLKGSTKEVAEGVSKDLGAISGSFNELSSALGGSDTQAGYLLGTLGELAKVGSDAAGAFASFSSGDIIGGITKTVSAVAGLFSIGKKVKEMNEAARKEVEDFYANAIKGEREYKDLLKERELQTIRNNKIALQGIRDEVALRKSQTNDYSKEASEIMAKLQGEKFIESETSKHGTWFRKAEVRKAYGSLQGKSFQELRQLLAQGKLEGGAKALVERLAELEAKGYDATQAMAALAKETSEIFTGTNRDNLTDSLLDMFRNGKTGAQDLANFFKTTMDEAALSIFKNKVLANAMDKFYTEFDKASQSDDELTSDEIARLNGLFTSLTGDAIKRFEEFKKVTGSDISNINPERTNIAGKLQKELTEQTGSQFLGVGIASLEKQTEIAAISTRLYQVALDSLSAAIKIERNTFRTADNTEHLKAIDRTLITIASNTTPKTTVPTTKADLGI